MTPYFSEGQPYTGNQAMSRVNLIQLILSSMVFYATCAQEDYTRINGVNWVISPSNVSQSEACHLRNMKSTSLSQDIPWNTEIMENVTAAFGRSVLAKPYGIHGCCVPGLFCDSNTCFTQSTGPSFFNYESVHPISAYTVYTCDGAPSHRVSISKATVSKGHISMAGSNFGVDELMMKATIGGKPCTDTESCSDMCNKCSRLAHNCSKDSVCLTVGADSSCYVYCSGPKDTSCPCGTTCQSVKVYIGDNRYLGTNFCGPANLNCGAYREENHMTCRSPRTYGWTSDPINTDEKVSMELSLAVNSDIALEKVSHTPDKCLSDGQCFDKSPYSSAVCSPGGECNYTLLSEVGETSEPMGSTFPRITDRNTRFSYVGLIAKDMVTEQYIFEGKVRLEGEKSRVSDVDDAPVDYHELDFPFRYFGNDVRDMNINPNGLIALPPFTECIAIAGSLRVCLSLLCISFH